MRVGQKGHTARDSSLPDGVAAGGTSNSETWSVDCVKVRRAHEREEENVTVKEDHNEKERREESSRQRYSLSVIISFCDNQMGPFASLSFQFFLSWFILSHHLNLALDY